MKKITSSIAVAVFVETALATNYVFVPTASDSDWSLASNYRDASGNEPSQCPGADDTVTAPEATYSLSVPSVSFAAFSNLRQVVPQNTTFSFAVESGEYTNCCAITCGASGNAPYKNGLIEKRGGGTLVLGADNVASVGTVRYDYYVDVSVLEGTLMLPQYSSGSAAHYGRTHVEYGATLYTTSQKPGGSAAFTYLQRLTGSGAVENRITSGSTRTSHSLAVCGNGEDASVFFGSIGKRITLYNVSGGGQIDLLGQDCEQSGTFVGGGKLLAGETYPSTWPRGVVSFGFASALGADGSTINMPSTDASSAHVLRYIGAGGADEHVPQKILLQSAGIVHVDVGANGGLVFDGDWEAGTENGASMYRLHRVVLAGSNSVQEAVLNGDLAAHAVVPNSRGVPDTNGWATTVFPVYVTKRGTGIWRMTDRAKTKGCGGYAIEDGTLRFESIAEKGVPCSLGLATCLSACDSEAFLTNALITVDYAYALGNLNGSPSLPVFEYVGTTDARCSTRPIALVGAGGELRNSTASGLSISGISARDVNSNPTLVLGGSGMDDGNVVSDVTDGASGARVNVVKTGCGTWRLGDGNAFTGDLDIREGTLVVEGETAYKWFRLTVKEVPGWTETLATDNFNYGMTVGQIALYDKDGIRQNAGLVQPFDPDNYKSALNWAAVFQRDPQTIPAGEAEFDCGFGGVSQYLYRGTVMGSANDYSKTYSYRLDCLFDDVNVTNGWFLMSYRNESTLRTGSASPYQRQPKLDNENSWIAFVMHLQNGAKEICSYDLCTSAHDEIGRWPVKFTLEGSCDGCTWTLLDDQTTPDYATAMVGKSSCWYSDGSSFQSGAVRSGFPVVGRVAKRTLDLSALRGISVADGAVLKAEGTGLSIDTFTFDANGSGTIEGFSFARDGEVSVVNATGAANQVLHVSFVGCSGVENVVSWPVVSVNGKKTNKYFLVSSNGEINLRKKVFALIVR